MFTLGIGFSHHCSIALLKNNQVVFLSLEERFKRIKEWGGEPTLIPTDCLDKVGSFTKTVDFLIGTGGNKKQLKDCVNYLKSKGVEVKKAGMSNPVHHLFHALSGFYMSPFQSASCLVIDGAGSSHTFNSVLRAHETTSVFEVDPNATPRYRSTYKHFTIGIYANGGLKNRVDNYPAIVDTQAEVTQHDIKTFNGMFSDVDNIVTTTALDTGIKYHCAAAKTGIAMGWNIKGCDGKLMGLSGYGNQASASPEEIQAYNAQRQLEQDFIDKIKYCKSNNIVISGGCALNILGNSHIKKTFPHLNIFVDPIAHDGTIALGAAVYRFYGDTKCKERLVIGPYTGLSYNITKDDIYERVRKYSI